MTMFFNCIFVFRVAETKCESQSCCGVRPAGCSKLWCVLISRWADNQTYGVVPKPYAYLSHERWRNHYTPQKHTEWLHLCVRQWTIFIDFSKRAANGNRGVEALHVQSALQPGGCTRLQQDRSARSEASSCAHNKRGRYVWTIFVKLLSWLNRTPRTLFLGTCDVL